MIAGLGVCGIEYIMRYVHKPASSAIISLRLYVVVTEHHQVRSNRLNVVTLSNSVRK